MLDLFQAESLAANEAAVAPAHRRGAIGHRAAAYGVLHEADDLIPPPSEARLQEDALCPLPYRIDDSWSAIADRVISLSEQAAAIGAYRDANLWRRNLGRPRSKYFNLEGLARMLAVMVRIAAGRSGQLAPVDPEWHIRSLDDVPAIAASCHGAATTLPASITTAIVQQLDRLVREIASRGFPNPNAVSVNSAPADVLALKARFNGICGATVRVIHQVGHLVAVSRAGQTAHNPMNLRRRHMLVDDALAQLVEHLCVDRWYAVEAGILTDDVRRAWASREAAEPLPPPIARNLFDWARISQLPPTALDDAELAGRIQSHPDLAYVDRLRDERRRRETLAAIPVQLASTEEPVE